MDITNVKQSKETKWQAFVDDALMKTGQVTAAAIFGLDGVKWAATKNFNVQYFVSSIFNSGHAFCLLNGQVSPSEVSLLLTCMTGDSSAVRRGGIKVGGQEYIFLRHEEGRSIYGRKGASRGVCIAKTKKAMIIGVYSSGIQPGNCNKVVEKLADYLILHEC